MDTPHSGKVGPLALIRSTAAGFQLSGRVLSCVARMIMLICFIFSAPASAEMPLPAPRPTNLPKPPPLAVDKAPAKQLFGAERLPNNLKSRAIGFYAKGCLAGARPLAV